MRKLLLLFFPVFAFAQPSNDECANATELFVNFSYYSEVGDTQGSFTNATPSNEGEVCTGVPDDDIWFKFTAAFPRHRMKLAGGPPYGRAYVVYENSCSGNIVACGIYGVYGNIMLNDLTPGEEYFIRFYHLSAASVSSYIFISITSMAEPMELLTNFTMQELVEEFVGVTMPPFFSISNVTSSTGSDFGDVNGITGYTASYIDFPLSGGLILSTGNILDAPGPNAFLQGAGTTAWPGDPDLEEILGPDDPGGFVNATSLEYDFVSGFDEIQVSFVFASEDYGSGQCGPSDAFAIILTNMVTGDKINLATIPGTIIPINVNTVRDVANNPDCTSENSSYFYEFYTTGDLFAASNFNGYTKRFDVTVPIEIAIPYHMKFVIADRGNPLNDSALFIDAGFNIGVPLLGPAAESPQQFTTGETLADLEVEGENIQWYASADGGAPIPAETPLEDGVTYYASQTVNGVESQNRTPVQVFEVLGNDENTISKLYAYPNPATGILHLGGTENIEKVVVTDILGNTVIQQTISDDQVSIDVSGLAAGVYFIKAVSGDAQKIIKIVKQ